ncbi:MAG: sugar ABC transporter permease [Candidatus Izemoplasmatales bacterium]|nr:sugar ABC transporter permease [Candidatus Izemoplasmatales bacterium]
MNKLKNALWSARNAVKGFFGRIRDFLVDHKLGFLVNWPRWFKAVVYLSPAMILLGIFTFYPIVNAFRLVVYEGYNSADGSITGYTLFGNFINVITEDNFIIPSSHTQSSVMINTLVIVFVSVPLSMIIALLIATALNSIKPLKGFFQTVYFLPYVTNAITIGLVFAYMFRSGSAGLVNKMLGVFGVDPVIWVERGATYWKAMFVLILYGIWAALAFKIMVFLTSIQGIDKQYYQAAAIDGTPKSRIFSKITVPLISPMIFYILITSVIGAFKTYNSVIAIFGNTGTPAGATYTLKTIVFYIYDYLNNATPGNLSLAAASSIVLFAIILLLTLVQMQVGKKRVHY